MNHSPLLTSLDDEKIKIILENNYIGQLAYIHQNSPYIVPITYYFDSENKSIICYSGEGHKMKAMRKNNAVSLQVSEIDSASNWKSVLAHGTFKQLFGSGAKAYLHKFSLGIKDVLMEKQDHKVNFISEFSCKIYKEDTPSVFVINVNEITGNMIKY